MQPLRIVCGALAFLIGLGFVCPQVAALRDFGALAAGQVLLLGLGVSLTVAGVIVCSKAASSLVAHKQASSGR
jgi:hypothetical protein